MVQFNTLRLNGFKSFADRTEIKIGDGLTGVVGPNGCGKSNLVEALRWVMGESSSKRMRGGSSMEDVIFNGTASRSSRNFAEVSISLDNRGRTAPAEFNNSDEIEVIRRIEKDKGSTYRINGKIVRARDVQMLFADVVVSANSPALVSQGRVTQMISAKPVERRKVLEESAGIAGLYARRHEAELRLRAADTNLARLEDITGSEEAQLASLKRQARQAQKYKNLSSEIRKTEALLACLEWSNAQESYKTSSYIVKETEHLVTTNMLSVTQLTKTQITQSETLPGLREKTSKASAAWQVQNVTLQRLEDEESQLEESLRNLKSNIENFSLDQKHEKENIVENQNLIERLGKEEKRHHDSQSKYKNLIEELKSEIETKSEQVNKLSSQYQAMLKDSAEQNARKSSLENNISKYKQQAQNCNADLDTANEKLKDLEKESIDNNLEDKYSKDIANFETQLSALSEKEKLLRQKYEILEASREKLIAEQSTKKETLASSQAQIETLSSFLDNFIEGNYTPVLEDITANEGLELALSRALGDTLQASLDKQSNKSWASRATKTSDLPSLPKGLKPLSSIVKAPKELSLALSMVGIADSTDIAKEALAHLKIGQSIVTIDGEYFRWDGYEMHSEAKDPQSEFLKQKNAIKDLNKVTAEMETGLSSITSKIDDIDNDRDNIRSGIKTIETNEGLLQINLKEAQTSLKVYLDNTIQNKEDIVRIKESISFNQSKKDELSASISSMSLELDGIIKAMSEKGDQQQTPESLKTELIEEQDDLNSIKIRYEQTVGDNKRREVRLHAIVDERLNVQNKLIRSSDQIKKYEQREIEAKEKLSDIKDRPSKIKEERETILNSITDLQSQKDTFQDTLNSAEEALRETNNALKEAESTLTQSKESRARAHATLEASEQQISSIRISIEDQFGTTIEELLHTSSSIVQENIEGQNTSIESLRKQKDRLSIDRERIGPVNLRADIEADEIEKQLTTILKEKNELEQAIGELRDGIEKLNNEARERLSIAFERINAYFQSLFTNLFGGGKAYLKLIDSADPLDAGLEIFAQPPGKSLQSLSLLSGGEQTLTSIALIFAMFLTNPSPICVLDEIDAPLDDANVDRVCDLIQDVAKRGNTRFLIITHHRLTMARMDRLYGVTMAERGISQLVSVDLHEQLDFIESA